MQDGFPWIWKSTFEFHIWIHLVQNKTEISLNFEEEPGDRLINMCTTPSFECIFECKEPWAVSPESHMPWDWVQFRKKQDWGLKPSVGYKGQNCPAYTVVLTSTKQIYQGKVRDSAAFSSELEVSRKRLCLRQQFDVGCLLSLVVLKHGAPLIVLYRRYRLSICLCPQTGVTLLSVVYI